MSGFFTKKETKSDTRPDGKTYSCVSCGRYKEAYTPKMEVSGDFKKGILNIADAPSRLDDRKGTPFQSKAFKLLEKRYDELGIDLHEDCLNTYANRCSSDLKAVSYQTDCCRKNIFKLIKKYKPKIIVLFGNEALYSIIGSRWKKNMGSIYKWQGWRIPDQDFKAWICPTFSPNSVLEAPSKVEEVLWNQDLEKIAQLTTKQFPIYKKPKIHYLKKDLSILNTIQAGVIAFDYESTGLKPYAEGHRIVCASVAVNEDDVYTFMIPKKKKNIKPFTDLLQRKSVLKIAQNMKYEDTWTNIQLNVPVNGWLWDTMLATHIIDNRDGVTGLKFQTYVQFGIIDYDSSIAPYLKAKDDTNSNAINQIEKLLKKPNGKKDLLKYCALDSINEYRLAKFQRKHIASTQGLTEISPINSDFPNAYSLLHSGVLALAKAERQGFRIDVKYCKQKKAKLTKQIKELENQIFNSKFYKHWQFTSKGKINLNSGDMLGTYLYKVKKIKPTKLTKGGKGKTDEEALQLLNIPELDMIIERSKLLKIRDTYLDSFLKEQVGGFLHPFFNLHLVKTYRSSSSNPNFQNIPKRNKMAMKTVRQAIYPRKGYQLLEMDYSGIEVAVAACYHKDPNMIKYITDPSTDMHGDMAKEIFKIDDWDRSRSDHSYLRAAAKNGFVFPQFYGDYYANNANTICSNWVHLLKSKWKPAMGYQLKSGSIARHLISKGIKSYDQFVNHIKKIENHFWTKRFAVYNKWKKRHYADYQKKGYISLKTGFVCKGIMSRNDVINYPVQGAAFHVLLWLFIEADKQLQAKGFKTRLIGQIHDAIIFDVHPKELVKVHNLIIKIGTQEILKAFPWINVPLSIDAELCPVDGSWAEKNDWKPLKRVKKIKK